MRIEHYRNQGGVVLFMCLIMLLLLTVMGISSVQTTSLQQRMARNASDTNLAFQAAESALRDGEILLESMTSTVNFDAGNAENNGFYYEEEPGDEPNWRTLDWSGANGYREAETEITGVEIQPKYILEHVKEVISDADSLNLDNMARIREQGVLRCFE